MDDGLVKRILMIAFHFPPVRISSGIQRTLKFSNYLRDAGWAPTVLSANPRAYTQTSDHQLGEIPDDVPVRRAFALDTSRHLAIRGRYPLFLALPDNWSSWLLGGVWSGLSLIKRQRPDVIWSTYPLATAHWIGLVLHKLTGIPWIADCRDSMTEDGYPSPQARRNCYLWLERRIVASAARVVFTTRGAARMYTHRYPDVPESRWAVIPNGFDEENFRSAEGDAGRGAIEGPVTLLHSGLLYPHERNPRPFFAAVSELKREGLILAADFRVKLRATGFDATYQPLIEQAGIDDIVSLEGRVDYREALAEMLGAHGLLIFQAASCNHQVPAKLYEYFRARRPILALTDPDGDTAAEMLGAGVDTIVPLDDKDAIKAGIVRFMKLVADGRAPVPEQAAVARYSRRARTSELAALLDEVVGEAV